jgi:hypothetical protein
MPCWKSRTLKHVAIPMALAIVLSTGIGITQTAAQATPPADTPLDVPAPDECQIEPWQGPLFPESSGRIPPATPAPLQTAPAPPFTPPEGEPADAETIAAVSATAREAIACRNANDLPRAYALFTQEMVTALFGGPATIDPEIMAALVEEQRPVPRRQRLAITDVTEVTLLPDGRVGAIIATSAPRREFRDYLIFEQDPATGQWLIDEARVMGNG